LRPQVRVRFAVSRDDLNGPRLGRVPSGVVDSRQAHREFPPTVLADRRRGSIANLLRRIQGDMHGRILMRWAAIIAAAS
jgi:hypothetical protein